MLSGHWLGGGWWWWVRWAGLGACARSWVCAALRPSSCTSRQRRCLYASSLADVLSAPPLVACLPARLQEERQEQDADFKPNLINTVCFLVNFIIQASHSPSLHRAPGRD